MKILKGKWNNGVTKKYDWGWSKWVNIVDDRKELVAPFAMRGDAAGLAKLYEKAILDLGVAYAGIDKLGGPKGKDADYAIRIMRKLVPQHVVDDIFSLFYHKSEDQEYSITNNSNRGKFKLLKHVNDGGLKIVTNKNSTHATMFAIEIACAILKAMLQCFNKQELKDLVDFMTDVKSDFSDEEKKEGEDNDNRFEELINKLCNSSTTETMIKEAKQKVLQDISKFEQLGLDLDRLVKDYGKDPGTLISELDNIRRSLERIDISRRGLRSLIENIVRKSTGFFSLKSVNRELSIFDADNIDDVSGIEFLHPVFRYTKLEDVVVNEKKYYGKMSVYIDISGSMDSSIIVNSMRTTALDFAKSVILTLFRMNILEHIFPFDYDVHPEVPLNEVDICLIDGDGGTSINRVIKHALLTGENSLVITDAQDSIDFYADNVFMVGTPGANFRLCREATKFQENRQLWVFSKDGRDIVPF